MGKFYVWLLPEKRKVLIDDRLEVPVFATNLSASQRELVKDLGGHKTFTRWEAAVVYGERIAKQMMWTVEYENEAGRQAEYEINRGSV